MYDLEEALSFRFYYHDGLKSESLQKNIFVSPKQLTMSLVKGIIEFFLLHFLMCLGVFNGCQGLFSGFLGTFSLCQWAFLVSKRVKARCQKYYNVSVGEFSMGPGAIPDLLLNEKDFNSVNSKVWNCRTLNSGKIFSHIQIDWTQLLV